MKNYCNVVAASLITLASSGAAAEEIFSCTIEKNKKFLQITQKNENLTYSYGPKKGTPELRITVPKRNIELFAWDGFGRYHNHSLTFPNGEYKYIVSTSYDSHEQTTTTGVNVLKGSSSIAELTCNPRSIKGSLEDYVSELKLSDG